MVHVYLCVCVMNQATNYIQKMRLPQVLQRSNMLKEIKSNMRMTVFLKQPKPFRLKMWSYKKNQSQ